MSAVSSNFGGGSLDSGFGGTRPLDGDPSTAWSSDGDGAFLEVDLGAPKAVAAVGFWTRTMFTSAQAKAFRVRAAGKTFGPFAVTDADRPFRYPIPRTTARVWRFEVVSSSGGNTGAVEVELFGAR